MMTPEKRTPGGNRANAKLCAGTARDHSTAPARLAPYSRAILTAQRAGKHPNVYLFAGSDAWNQAEHRRRTHGDGSALLLPAGDDPAMYRWPALDALVLVPGDADGDTVRRLIVAMLTAGCRCIVEVRPDQAPACHYADESDAREAA